MIDMKNLVGLKFGRLLVVERHGSRKYKNCSRALWKCKCECGNTCLVETKNLTTGNTRSCGCLYKEVNKISKYKKHGYCSEKHPLYLVWKSIKQRCNNPKNHEYNVYGGKGIKICDNWERNPDEFIKWALSNGYKCGLEIDRIDNNKGYSEDNCQFITKSENVKKKDSTLFITVDGITKTASEWNNVIGYSHSSIQRIYKRKGKDFAIDRIKNLIKERGIYVQ